MEEEEEAVAEEEEEEEEDVTADKGSVHVLCSVMGCEASALSILSTDPRRKDAFRTRGSKEFDALLRATLLVGELLLVLTVVPTAASAELFCTDAFAVLLQVAVVVSVVVVVMVALAAEVSTIPSALGPSRLADPSTGRGLSEFERFDDDEGAT